MVALSIVYGLGNYLTSIDRLFYSIQLGAIFLGILCISCKNNFTENQDSLDSITGYLKNLYIPLIKYRKWKLCPVHQLIEDIDHGR